MSGVNATVTNVFINRTAGGNEPAVDVTNGPLRLVKTFVIQKAGIGSVGVSSSGAGGLGGFEQRPAQRRRALATEAAGRAALV